MSDRIYIDLICLVGNPNSLLNLKIITVFYGDSPFVITSSFSFYFSIPLASLFFHFIVKSLSFTIFFSFFGNWFDLVLVLVVMEEQFILRVTPFVAKRLDCLLSENENASFLEDKS